MSFCLSIRSSRNLKGFMESFLFNQRVIEEEPYRLITTIPPVKVKKSSRDETADRVYVEVNFL